MKESRCKNSRALLFHPGPEDKETIDLKQKNKSLEDRIDALEEMVNKLLSKKAKK